MNPRQQVEAYLSELAARRELEPLRTTLPEGTEVLDFPDGTRLVFIHQPIEFITFTVDVTK
jgi:hypothetical protein